MHVCIWAWGIAGRGWKRENTRRRACEGCSNFYCVLVGACAGAVCVKCRGKVGTWVGWKLPWVLGPGTWLATVVKKKASLPNVMGQTMTEVLKRWMFYFLTKRSDKMDREKQSADPHSLKQNRYPFVWSQRESILRSGKHFTGKSLHPFSS